MSKIEVNEIDAQSGSTITVGSACKSVAVPGNVVKTNAVQASDGGNIVSQSGTTITLGASGDTVSLASGASQSGFGRAGSVDWQTGSIKTGNFTAADGEGYFVDTSSGAVTASLPAGSAGAIVAFSDYARNFATNNFIITPNGSEKIAGTTGSAILDVDGQGTTLVYVDATKGWINVQNAEDTETGQTLGFISATGGTITTVCTNFKVHTFTGPGTFSVTSGAGPTAVVDYLVLAGGGGAGGGEGTGGGGAGGYRESGGTSSGCYSVSPLGSSPSSVSGITMTPGCYSISVGSGGAGSPDSSPQHGNQGGTSSFKTITSAGGGAGGGGGGSPTPEGTGGTGGSGGGGGGRDNKQGGSGNTPPVAPPQGQNGGASTSTSSPPNIDSGGGGGGAGAVGTGGSGGGPGGTGGAGVASSITGSPVTRGGGGGGASQCGSAGPGGSGGGGAGGGGTPSPSAATAGTENTGGGGGGRGAPTGGGANGGSGIVILRYRFQ